MCEEKNARMVAADPTGDRQRQTNIKTKTCFVQNNPNSFISVEFVRQQRCQRNSTRNFKDMLRKEIQIFFISFFKSLVCFHPILYRSYCTKNNFERRDYKELATWWKPLRYSVLNLSVDNVLASKLVALILNFNSVQVIEFHFLVRHHLIPLRFWRKMITRAEPSKTRKPCQFCTLWKIQNHENEELHQTISVNRTTTISLHWVWH